MFLTAAPPPPALSPFVASLGYLEAPFGYARERVLPSGGMQLLVNLDVDEFRTYHGDQVRRVAGAALQGPGAQASIIDTAQQRAVAWVNFRPGGARPFFTQPLWELRDTLIGLDDLWGRDGAVLRERLLCAPSPLDRLRVLEAALVSRAVRPLHPERALRHAVGAFERGAAVSAVTDALGFTAKRFGRLCTDHLGLTPKRFARVRRFQRLIESVGAAGSSDAADTGAPRTAGAARTGAARTADAARTPDRARDAVDWARLAVEHGYHDQAHMIHDFQAFSGLTPTQYRPRSPHELNHVPL
ncbi:MAG: AraC family transcriptional regulator [Micromonosporaceae bacterium]|nr:AraC family transcriptional regulator [Micromonosporaceae bacterium]